MASRPRDRRRRDWPEGLREPRPGYYTWRKPDGKEMAIGRVTLAQAKQEAIAANEFVRAQKPTLVERLSGAANNVAQLLAEMPKAEKKNTEKSWRSLDKKIKETLGELTCNALTVKHCADLIETEHKAGRKRQAQAIRSRMVAVFAKGMSLGYMDFNPAEPTRNETVSTKRARLTLEQFKAIHAKAPEVNEWLAGAMVLALVSGQDRATLSSLDRTGIGAEYLTAMRGKTGVTIEIPLRLRLDALGLTLADALAGCRSNVVSKYRYVIHHARKHGNAPLGSKVHPDRLSHAFAEARDLAGIKGDHPPTWHEIRSLAKRLYKAQGGVDTKALLGHLTDRMSELYENPRGAEPIRVTLG
jgi:enterobacteria phage integrase